MRILHLGKYFPPVHGGMERFLADLIRAQRARGDEAFALVHADQASEARDDPPWLWRCPVWLKLVFAPISPTYPFWLARALRHARPDILHLHMPNLSALWALFLPAARRLPWVVHWHSDVESSRFKLSLRLAYPLYRRFERALLERAEAIVVTSPPYLESSRPLRPWRHKCVIIPLGLDPDRLPDTSPETASSLWRTPGMRLLAIGRLTYYKGFETLIRAVARHPQTELVIVGEGEERPHLERVLDEIGHPPWIRLLGGAEDATCRQLLASCDVFCLPSRERTEAFGIVLLEAMRYGKPLLVGDIPGSGVTWVVREGENGRRLPPEDVAAWERALAEWTDTHAERQRLGNAGRQRFLAEFDIARVAERLNALYPRLLDEMTTRADTHTQPLIVIPALDEAESIGQVIADVRAAGFDHIVVIDDGSQDDTGAIATRQGATVLRAPLRQGAWGAMQTGIRHAMKRGYPAVITMDADGQHEPGYLPALLAAGADADVVIGAYPERGSRMRRLAWAYFRRLTGFNYEDLTSGFRYYNLKASRLLASTEATLLDYQDVGVLLLLHKAGLRVREIPVAMNPRQVGASRIFSSWWTVGRYMAETSVLCLARWKIRPGVVDTAAMNRPLPLDNRH